MLERQREIGNIPDTRCKQNSVKRITEDVCKNNCKYFKYNEKIRKRVCVLGYRKIKIK